MTAFGVYIHYPWCRYRCPYCDFPIAVAKDGEIPHHRYLDCVARELTDRAGSFDGLDLASIYLGGGTPALWPAEHLDEVISRVRRRFAATGDLEITLEANPIDCTAEAMVAWKRAGINRLSIGVQSFDDSERVTLGRDHRMGDGPAAVAIARHAGFSCLSLDLILGVPGGAGDRSAEQVLDVAPEHISIYELTIEDGAPFAGRVARGELCPLDDDAMAELYSAVDRRLTAAGYEHYEVSSYARDGKRARHNSLYWAGSPYLGLGNGAASLIPAADGAMIRQTNQRSVTRYMAADPAGRVAVREELSASEMARDRLWLGLRTRRGVVEEAMARLPDVRAWLLEQGLAVAERGRIRPTLRGFLFHDQVARRVVGSWR